MTISEERLEELMYKLILRLQDDMKDQFNIILRDTRKDKLQFLFEYISRLKKDDGTARGNRSFDSYVYIDFPLSKSDFTEEELKYLNFYDED